MYNNRLSKSSPNRLSSKLMWVPSHLAAEFSEVVMEAYEDNSINRMANLVDMAYHLSFHDATLKTASYHHLLGCDDDFFINQMIGPGYRPESMSSMFEYFFEDMIKDINVVLEHHNVTYCYADEPSMVRLHMKHYSEEVW